MVGNNNKKSSREPYIGSRTSQSTLLLSQSRHRADIYYTVAPPTS